LLLILMCRNWHRSLSVHNATGPYFAGGNANHSASSFDRIHHYRVRADDRVVADVNTAQNLRAGAEYDVVAVTPWKMVTLLPIRHAPITVPEA
jgi:hypothetical protein